jgi:hypothetical protein
MSLVCVLLLLARRVPNELGLATRAESLDRSTES